MDRKDTQVVFFGDYDEERTPVPPPVPLPLPPVVPVPPEPFGAKFTGS